MYILAFCRKLISVLMDRRYRPELHYMRGPGPKWFEKYGRSVQASFRVGRERRAHRPSAGAVRGPELILPEGSRGRFGVSLVVRDAVEVQFSTE
jgi:hypothetical protein